VAVLKTSNVARDPNGDAHTARGREEATAQFDSTETSLPVDQLLCLRGLSRRCQVVSNKLFDFRSLLPRVVIEHHLGLSLIPLRNVRVIVDSDASGQMVALLTLESCGADLGRWERQTF
jgi:hypothetical protein